MLVQSFNTDFIFLFYKLILYQFLVTIFVLLYIKKSKVKRGNYFGNGLNGMYVSMARQHGVSIAVNRWLWILNITLWDILTYETLYLFCIEVIDDGVFCIYSFYADSRTRTPYGLWSIIVLTIFKKKFQVIKIEALDSVDRKI